MLLSPVWVGRLSKPHGGSSVKAVITAKEARRITLQFFVTIDRDEDGMWIVECPSIPGCVSQGETRDEALENIKEAITLCLEVREEKGVPLTIETAQLEVAAGCQNCRP